MSRMIKAFNATADGQKNMLGESAENSAKVNETFMHMVQSGVTRQDLERCIQHRPALWKRFENWLDKLPTERPLSKGVA